MRSDRKLYDIALEIYEIMYRNATPKANLEELISKGITKKKDWFNNYYLDIDIQKEIVDKICKKYKCSRLEKRKIETEVYLGASPRGSKI